MVAGFAGSEFLEDRQGAAVANLAECPDGSVSLPETVIFRLNVRHQRLYPVAGVLLHCLSTYILDA